eukprot:GHVU01023712.1.p2 GENE.GHVU01023712.1~~GHVU01023712.1.p2  ORF type:complete len:108 (+),score=13.97 GHVU01023712.1:162-485(+)
MHSFMPTGLSTVVPDPCASIQRSPEEVLTREMSRMPIALDAQRRWKAYAAQRVAMEAASHCRRTRVRGDSCCDTRGGAVRRCRVFDLVCSSVQHFWTLFGILLFKLG